MNGLPQGYTIRSAKPEDIETIATAINDYTLRLVDEALYRPEAIRRFLTTPGFDLAKSCRLVFSPSNSVAGISNSVAGISNSVAGMALVMDIEAPYVQIMVWGLVPEEEQGKGIGSALHAWIEPRAREAIAKAPVDARVFLMQSLFDQDEPAKAFLTQHGYMQTRHYWRMGATLDDAPQKPTWPDGIIVQTVDLRENLDAPFRALDEAFSDHYGHVAGDFEQKLERQRHNLENDPDYSPDFSFVAMDGDKIAAVCMCSPQSGLDTTIGYVNGLGVLRPWRKRGLGLALLNHAFGVFKQKGKIGAALHVDAQSLTGATRLYEKAGMRVDQLSHEYQLELRPGVDLSTAS